MALTIEQVIKIILVVFLVTTVVVGAYLFLKNQIIDFFGGLSAENTSGIFIALIR